MEPCLFWILLIPDLCSFIGFFSKGDDENSWALWTEHQKSIFVAVYPWKLYGR